MYKVFKNKTILITGGTGSFGKKFLDSLLLNNSPNKIIIFSRDEQKQFQLQHKLKAKNLRFFLGDIRDKNRLNFALKNVDIVIHAAALKHVESGEYNPFEVVKTNILGTQNLIDAAIENNVKKVISLSTDKASSPLNLYGATKLTSDKLIVAANNYKGNSKTIFSVVRYGNVMGSRGSVIPLFLQQKEKGVFSITDPKMTRFNITLQESVNFVIKALHQMLGGEIFVPKIKSYRVLDLAKSISSKTKIKIIGLRSGEKIHEEMISLADANNTIQGKGYFIILPVSSFNNLNKSNYLKKFKTFKSLKRGFVYSSNNNEYLSISELKKLIKENKTDFE
jgi:UDP-N-acetylglucosamine 4,6-dehydratase